MKKKIVCVSVCERVCTLISKGAVREYAKRCAPMSDCIDIIDSNKG